MKEVGTTWHIPEEGIDFTACPSKLKYFCNLEGIYESRGGEAGAKEFLIMAAIRTVQLYRKETEYRTELVAADFCKVQTKEGKIDLFASLVFWDTPTYIFEPVPEIPDIRAQCVARGLEYLEPIEVVPREILRSIPSLTQTLWGECQGA